MERLRQRIPFKLAEDDDDENLVLDDQQQEAMIADLRKIIGISNRRYYLLLKIVVGVSLALQLFMIHFNPLLVIFPVTSPEPSLPAPAVFALLSLFIHLNLALISMPEEARTLLQTDNPPTPLSFQMLYCLSGVAPTFALSLYKPLQTAVSWCITPYAVFVVQSVVDALHANSDAMTHVEKLQYNARGV